MVRHHGFRYLTLALSLVVLAAATNAQAKGLLSRNANSPLLHDQPRPESCRGGLSLVTDVGFEDVLTTAHNFNSPTGGGESKRFDKTPVLSTKVELREGCLNAHLSALVGSAQTYGTSPVTLFQVTLTSSSDPAATPQHMYGHFETPYGIYGPAVAIEAENDVDELGANFFQRVGFGRGEVPPGTYYVDVWWAGGPTAPGGAIGGAFVLKLYQ